MPGMLSRWRPLSALMCSAMMWLTAALPRHSSWAGQPAQWQNFPGWGHLGRARGLAAFVTGTVQVPTAWELSKETELSSLDFACKPCRLLSPKHKFQVNFNQQCPAVWQSSPSGTKLENSLLRSLVVKPPPVLWVRVLSDIRIRREQALVLFDGQLHCLERGADSGCQYWLSRR